MSAEFLGALAFVAAGLLFLGALVAALVHVARRTLREAEEQGSPAERVLAEREWRRAGRCDDAARDDAGAGEAEPGERV